MTVTDELLQNNQRYASDSTRAISPSLRQRVLFLIFVLVSKVIMLTRENAAANTAVPIK